MSATTTHGRAAFAAALLALLLLAVATVKSTLMQVEMATAGAPMPFCGGHMVADVSWAMADESGAAAVGHGVSKTNHGRPSACPFCSAAAHAPTTALGWSLGVPVAITFVAFRVIASHGPRGPPAATPRARGPPQISTRL